MRLKKVALSNILSFPYVNNIADAVCLDIDPTLNIIIGGNGSGKSTLLEAINFVFKRVLFRQYYVEEGYFQNPIAQSRPDVVRLDPGAQNYKSSFRLGPNWGSESMPQTIELIIQLDEVDKTNLHFLGEQHNTLLNIASNYSRLQLPRFTDIHGGEEITIDISLNEDADNFSVSHNAREDIYFYLSEYEYLNELIAIYNRTTSAPTLPRLCDTFTMLAAFRNYHSFNTSAVLSTDDRSQLRSIKQSNYSKSVNGSDGGEPLIFSVVRIRLASEQYRLAGTNMTDQESEDVANQLSMLTKINKKLSVINLRCSIKLIERRTWSYAFNFYDTKHDRIIGDINSLSAGQRAIVHLIFEAYGRDDMRGGVVVIDEPEIHLHYQFQYEYLMIMQSIIDEQRTQYIVVTHSDSFINSTTAPYLKRFALDEHRQSVIYSPTIGTAQKKLIEILDNSQSARALFGNKVLLVEGPDDRYFFRALFDKKYPTLRQEVSVYDTGSKCSHESWKELFESYGIKVYRIKDLDAAFIDIYNNRSQYSLVKQGARMQFRAAHPDLDEMIENQYQNQLYILKQGALEEYTQSRKGLEYVIRFCENLDNFLGANTAETNEVLMILEKINE